MEKNKGKVKLNEELLDQVAGGRGDGNICPYCFEEFPADRFSYHLQKCSENPDNQ